MTPIPKRPGPSEVRAPGGGRRYESWLVHYFDRELSEIDAACSNREPAACMPLFRGLPDSVWAMLLSREYASYPAIRAALPELPDPERQIRWNGAAGHELLIQSQAFYSHVLAQAHTHLSKPVEQAQLLDFGCGWGRLTRLFARDVEPGALYGCDPVEEILDTCRQSGVTAKLALSDFVPEQLPFPGQRFDLVIAFSIFTHISEAAHEAALRAIAHSLAPGGIVVVTVRPPAYLNLSPHMAAERERIGPGPLAKLAQPRYVFAPHDPDPDHPQYAGEEMTYGEAVISAPYLRQRWSREFELLDLAIPLVDMHQVTVTMRKRD